MPSQEYSQEQIQAIRNVNKALHRLQEYEKLTQQKYRPIYSLHDQLESDTADLMMDMFPSYNTMEENLKNAITRAKEAGVGKAKGMKELEQLAFQSV